MKRYRKFEYWLADVEKCLDHPVRSVDESPLRFLAYSFSGIEDQLLQEGGRVRKLIAVLKKLREARGAGRGVFEERIMQALVYQAMMVCAELQGSGLRNLSLSTESGTIPSEQRLPFVFVQELYRYAMDCLVFSRPRDSLVGQRRAVAFEIFESAVGVIEPPISVLDTAQSILKAGRSKESIRGVLVFFEAYYGEQPEGVPEEVEEILLRLVGKTDSRSLAVGALNVLVESGNISEFAALDNIDDWKERNNYG